MGKNGKAVLNPLLRSESFSVKGDQTMNALEVEEAGYRLEEYFDKVFEVATREIKVAFPDATIYRNGVKQ